MPITVPASARAAALAAVFAVTPFVTTSAASLVSPVADRPLRSAPAAERLVPAASGPAAVSPAGGYRWPLDGAPEVVRPFDPPPRPWLPGHRGVDLAGVPGAPVYAAGTGVVRFAGQLAGRGVVSIDHP